MEPITKGMFVEVPIFIVVEAVRVLDFGTEYCMECIFLVSIALSEIGNDDMEVFKPCFSEALWTLKSIGFVDEKSVSGLDIFLLFSDFNDDSLFSNT